MFKVSNEEINIHSNIIFQRIWVTEHPIPLKCLQVLSNMRSYAYACVSSGFQLECKSLDLSLASSKREEISFNADEASEEQEAEEQRETESSPFISALSKTLSLWPEDEEKHECPSWRAGTCRNLKCLVEREKENREWDAAGYCDNCEENKNNCECDQGLE